VSKLLNRKSQSYVVGLLISHLTHIAKMFTDGNFQIPMFVHDRMPPGADVMQQKKDKITYP